MSDALVVGTIEGDVERPLTVVSMEVGGETRSLVTSEAFRLRVGEDCVEVARNENVVLLPERSVEGDFGDLIDDPLCDQVMDYAPGDHVHTVLRGNTFRVGDRVSVYGQVEYALDNDGYRGASGTQVRKVMPVVVVIGDDAERLVEEWRQEREEQVAADNAAELAKEARRAQAASKKKAKAQAKAELEPPVDQPASLWSAAVFGFAALAFAGLCVVNTSVAMAVLGFAMADFALFAWRRKRWMPCFHTFGDVASGTRHRWSVWVQVSLYLSVLWIVAAFATEVPSIALMISASLALPLLGLVVYQDQRAAQTGLTLLRTARLPEGFPDKRYGAVEGQFAGSLSYRRTHTKTTEQTHHGETGKTTVHWKETARSSTATLQCGEQAIDLGLRGAEWAGADYVIAYPDKPSESAHVVITFFKGDPTLQAKFIEDDKKSRPIVERTANDGDSALVAGRMDSDGRCRFKATGPGSLVLFTSPPGTSARGALRTHLLMHYMGIAGFVILIVARAVWAIQLW